MADDRTPEAVAVAEPPGCSCMAYEADDHVHCHHRAPGDACCHCGCRLPSPPREADPAEAVVAAALVECAYDGVPGALGLRGAGRALDALAEAAAADPDVARAVLGRLGFVQVGWRTPQGWLVQHDLDESPPWVPVFGRVGERGDGGS